MEGGTVMGRLIPPLNRRWDGPRTICSLCGASLPCPKVPPAARGAIAVSGYFCPRCDGLTQEQRHRNGGR